MPVRNNKNAFLYIITLFLFSLFWLLPPEIWAEDVSSAQVIIGQGGRGISSCFYCQKDRQWEEGATKGHCRQPVIARNGCGPTSMAMILCSFGINTNPTLMWNEYMKDGYLTYCATAWAAHTAIPKKYGLKVDDTIGKNFDIAKKFLEAGWLIIVSSRMTSAGHILVITGIEGDTVTTNDPLYCETGKDMPYSKSYLKVSRMWAIKK